MANEQKTNRPQTPQGQDTRKPAVKSSGRSMENESTPSQGQNKMDSQNTRAGSSSLGSAQMESATGERKSISKVIAQSLAEDNQEGVERVLSEVKRYFDNSRSYISENPREAAGLALAAGVAAWALLGTKPGRMVFESGAAVAVPFVTKWFSRNLTSFNH